MRLLGLPPALVTMRLIALGFFALICGAGACVDAASADLPLWESEDCGGGVCPASTPECPSDQIFSRDASICAVCSPPRGSVEICGTAVVARCEARENAAGAACRYCQTEAGEVLFDSCYTQTADSALVCETSSEGAAGVESPVAGDSAGDGAEDPAAEFECKTCNDEFGNVVRSGCEPIVDECHTEDQDGLGCRVCTRGGVVVVRECEPRGAPRFCQAYEDDDGRCVDCYDDDDALLSHACTLTGEARSCVRSVTPEGIECETCTDVRGVIASRTCFEALPVKQCEVLDYTGQTCEICVDEGGRIVSQVCVATGCSAEDTSACAPPPPCTLTQGADGSICRICPVAGSNEPERRCLFGSALQCKQGVVDGTSAGDCTVCFDGVTGQEVYRRCDGSSNLPSCAPSDGPEGQLCEVCSDPVTLEPFYSRCDDQVCRALGSFGLQTEAGSTLYFEQAPAVASCSTCEGPAAATTCTLRSDCGGVSLDGASVGCADAVSFRLEPRVCGNPWQPNTTPSQPPPPPLVELLDVMSWALEAGPVGVIDAVSSVVAPPACVDSCACARGDEMELRVSVEDAPAMVLLFDQVLVRCASDADCGGGFCRADGGCAR